MIADVTPLEQSQLNSTDSDNPYQSPGTIGGPSPASKSLGIGIATFAIVFASLCLAVLLIAVGMNPTWAGNIWMLFAMLASGTGATRGFFAAFANRTIKWQVTARMCFALILNSVMLMFSMYCMGCSIYGISRFAVEMWSSAG